jgi:hypothetical protein
MGQYSDEELRYIYMNQYTQQLSVKQFNDWRDSCRMSLAFVFLTGILWRLPDVCPSDRLQSLLGLRNVTADVLFLLANTYGTILCKYCVRAYSEAYILNC